MKKPGIGVLRNVTISNIEATGANPTGCAISGLPEAQIEDVTLSNLRLSFAGGGTKQEAGRVVPEKPTAYPEYSMFGKLPAYGLYCRHVKGFKLSNVQLQLAKEDKRHALVLEDVDDALIDRLDAAYSAGASSTVRLSGVKDVLIRGCRPKVGTDVFLRLEGSGSEGVTLVGNDLSGAARAVKWASDVPEKALFEMANRMSRMGK
jgi:hypothetical protein